MQEIVPIELFPRNPFRIKTLLRRSPRNALPPHPTREKVDVERMGRDVLCLNRVRDLLERDGHVVFGGGDGDAARVRDAVECGEGGVGVEEAEEGVEGFAVFGDVDDGGF